MNNVQNYFRVIIYYIMFGGASDVEGKRSDKTIYVDRSPIGRMRVYFFNAARIIHAHVRA